MSDLYKYKYLKYKAKYLDLKNNQIGGSLESLRDLARNNARGDQNILSRLNEVIQYFEDRKINVGIRTFVKAVAHIKKLGLVLSRESYPEPFKRELSIGYLKKLLEDEELQFKSVQNSDLSKRSSKKMDPEHKKFMLDVTLAKINIIKSLLDGLEGKGYNADGTPIKK